MFFSHIGWLLIKKHPDVMKYGNKLNYDDILSDPIVKFQRKLVALFLHFLTT